MVHKSGHLVHSILCIDRNNSLLPEKLNQKRKKIKVMKNKLIYGGLSMVVVVLAIVFSGYLISSKPEPKKDNERHNTVYVKAEPVHVIDTQSDMSYRGRVTAFDNVSLAAEVQGKLMQGDVRFKAGQQFKKNDVLIKVYSEDVEASLKAGKSSFLQTLSKILPDIKIDYGNEYEKWNSFFNAIDVEKALPALPPIVSDNEKVFLAANNVLSGYYSLEQQEITLSKYTIRAPFSGSFKSVNKEIGAIASPGSELATIIRMDKLEVTVSVFPSDLKWIHTGDQVQIKKDGSESKTATVSRISSFVNEASQSVDVYLTYVTSANDGFLQGEYVDAIFKGAAVSGFEIPRESLLDDGFVYELRDKKLEKVKVNILRQLDDSYIIAGLDANQTIVTESLASVNSNVEYLAR